MKRFLVKCGICLVVVGVLCGLVTGFVVNPAAYAACEVKVRAEMVAALNRASLAGLDGAVAYDDLFTVEKDAAGKIVLIGANTPKINQIVKSVAEEARVQTLARAEEGVAVQLATFAGISYLSGAGGSVTFDVQPAGAVDVKLESQFLTAGVNQTLHRLVARFSAAFDLILPLSSREIRVTSEMLVCENVLVGEVPDIWLETGGGSLNFVPRFD